MYMRVGEMNEGSMLWGVQFYGLCIDMPWGDGSAFGMIMRLEL